MKLITFITLIIGNCIIALASPAWERIVIDISDDLTNGFRDDISYPEDFNIAAELHVAPDCIKTVSGGAATVLNQIFTKECALITYDGGYISKDYKFNCCGKSTWIRVNNKDWFYIKSQGKLDGLRFQQTYEKDDARYINFLKITGTESRSIDPEQFLP